MRNSASFYEQKMVCLQFGDNDSLKHVLLEHKPLSGKANEFIEKLGLSSMYSNLARSFIARIFGNLQSQK